MVDKCYRQQVQGGNETVEPVIFRDYKLKYLRNTRRRNRSSLSFGVSESGRIRNHMLVFLL